MPEALANPKPIVHHRTRTPIFLSMHDLDSYIDTFSLFFMPLAAADAIREDAPVKSR